MGKNKRILKNAVAILCAATLMFSALIGCKKEGNSQSNGSESNDKGPFKITIMLPTFTADTMNPESPALKALEEYTNTDIEFIWVPNASYNDKMNVTMASSDLPMMMYVPNKSSSIINAVKAGGFWEIGPYLKNYKNLSKANEIILYNTSIEGKVYGIYRGRPLGRNGIIIRKDWLEALNMEAPKTMDDFYNMLVAFRDKDPDKNGQNDTYGMIVTKFSGPFFNMSVWNGAPNKWGIDENGKLYPEHMAPEYMETLKLFKKMYDEKLINQDFAVMDSAKWEEPFINNKAGVIIDVLDRGRRLSEKFEDMGTNQTVEVVGTIEGPKGRRSLPTSGYAGFFMFPKSSIKDEATLDKVLTFVDKTNDEEALNIITNGVEGRHYRKLDGYIEKIDDPNIPDNELADFQQLLTGVNEDNKALGVKTTPMRQKVDDLMKENEDYVVANPAEPFISETYSKRGPQLDAIIEDAMVKYIVGQIDEAGYQAELDLWLRSGGQQYIDEINAEYAKAQANRSN